MAGVPRRRQGLCDSTDGSGGHVLNEMRQTEDRRYVASPIRGT